MINRAEKIRSALREKKLIVGTHVRSQDPLMSELLAKLGFDILWIENEHANLDKYQTMLHVMAAQGAGAAAVVRVPWNDPVLVKPLLEVGVDGIIFPMVSTAEEAARAVASCTYPSRGIRGFGPLRSNDFGIMDTQQYLEQADSSILKIIQIEHHLGAENIEQILDVEGIDAVVVGQFDLSGTLGILGQIYAPENIACIKKVSDACKRRGIPFGMSSDPRIEKVQFWRELGAEFIFVNHEYEWVRMAAGQTLRQIREEA